MCRRRTAASGILTYASAGLSNTENAVTSTQYGIAVFPTELVNDFSTLPPAGGGKAPVA